MITYNVTIKVDPSIEEEWLRWMENEHMPALFDTGCFDSYQLHKLLEQDETEGMTYVAQYQCKSLNEYNDYIKNHAQQMREEGIRRFGDKFIAFRTLMQKKF